MKNQIIIDKILDLLEPLDYISKRNIISYVQDQLDISLNWDLFSKLKNEVKELKSKLDNNEVNQKLQKELKETQYRLGVLQSDYDELKNSRPDINICFKLIEKSKILSRKELLQIMEKVIMRSRLSDLHKSRQYYKNICKKYKHKFGIIGNDKLEDL